MSSSSPVQMVLSIEDLLLQILMRLPIESLIQFKSVSNHWYSLITSPDFCYQRSSKPAPAVGLLLRRECNLYGFLPFSTTNPATAPFRRLNFIKDPSSAIDIVHSCNGLLLCRTNTSDFKGHFNPEEERYYYICNPTTKKFFTLPKVPICNPTTKKFFTLPEVLKVVMYLAYDPSKSPHYKVVAICPMLIDVGIERVMFLREIWIYSSQVDSWKKCRGPPKIRINLQLGATYWNGALHRFDYIEEDDDDGDIVVKANFLVFKIDDETLHIMPNPPHSFDRWSNNDCLLVSGDHLHYMEMFPRQIKFNIYEMKKDYSEWFVKYQVDLSCLVRDYPEMRRDHPLMRHDLLDRSSSVYLVRGEEDDGSFLVFGIPGKIIKYYIMENRHETLLYNDGSIGSFLFKTFFRGEYDFIQSLCLI